MSDVLPTSDGVVAERLTREPPDKWPELLVVATAAEPAEQALEAVGRLGRVGTRKARRALLDVIRCEVGCKRWVEAGLEEGEEEVKNVDSEGIADDIPLGLGQRVVFICSFGHYSRPVGAPRSGRRARTARP
jgi:hypothetical protein